MPYSNPLSQAELQDLTFNNPLHPRDGSPSEVYMPPAYFMVPPATQNGPVRWRLFDAAYISTGIIDPNRLGTGATGAGNLYLADDGTWKTVSVGGGGDMLKATYDTDNSGVVDNAERIAIVGRNATGVTLYRGTIVYISGSTGNRPNFVKAQANAESTSAGTFGVVLNDILNNSDGYVAHIGVLDNLDTRSTAPNPFTDVTLADGDTLYLHPTIAGYVTNVKPSAPNHLVYVGKVTRTSPTNGTIVYRIQNGYELDEIHDVAISSKADNDLLVYESATNLWKNKTFAAIFGGTPLVAVPTLAQVTTAGNTTTNAITVGGLTANNKVYLGSNTPHANDATNIVTVNGIMSLSNGYIRIDGQNRVQISTSGWTWDTAITPTAKGYQGYSIQDFTLRTGSTSYNLDLGLAGQTNLRIANTTGNVLINTTTDAGYKLDVNGSIAARQDITIFSERYLRQEGVTAKFSSQLGIFQFDRWQSGPVTAMYINGWGNYTYLNTALNLGTNSTTVESMLSVYGSRTAASAIARGVYFNNTLVAAANNDVLVGLDINPTYTKGAFTGVLGYGLRITSPNTTDTALRLVATEAIYAYNAATRVTFNIDGTYGQLWNVRGLLYIDQGANSDMIFRTNAGSERMRIFAAGNIGINTSTDAGYKLDVNGTVRVGGTTYFGNTNNQIQQDKRGGTTSSSYLTLLQDGNNRTFTFYQRASVFGAGVDVGMEIGAGFLTLPYYQALIGASTATSNAKLIVTGSITASTALAQGVYFNNTLVAAANNDVLVGLDINPTFTNGAFTGVSNYAVRVTNTSVALFDSVLYSQAGPSTNNTNFSITGTASSDYTVYSSRNFIFNTGQSMYFNTDIDGGAALERNWYFGGARSGTTGGRTYVSITTDSSGFPRLVIYNNDNTAKINLDSTAASYFNAGNVLIGTTTDAGYKLDVAGTIRAKSASGNIIQIDHSTGSTIFNVAANKDISFNDYGQIYFFKATNILSTYGIGSDFNIRSGSVIDALWIKSNGNILMGTSTDSGYKLQVAGTTRSDKFLVIDTGNNSVFRIGASTSSEGGLYMRSGAASDGEIAGGVYFVGGFPYAAATGASAINFYAGDTYFTGNSGLTVGASFVPSTRMLLKANGNLLIGTTTDIGYTLNVNGTARVAGNTVVSGKMGIGSSAGIIAPTLFVYGAKGSFGTFSDTVAGFKSTGNTYISIDSDSGNDTGVQYISNGVTNWVLLNSRSLGGFASYSTAFGYTTLIKDNGNFLIGTTTDTGEKLQVNGDIRAVGTIKSLYQAGDEGGEITLNKPATGTVIDTSVTIDIYQNKLRIFESGGLNRGGYFDISGLANGVGTNLAPSGFTGTFTVMSNPPGQQNLHINNGIITSID